MPEAHPFSKVGAQKHGAQPTISCEKFSAAWYVGRRALLSSLLMGVPTPLRRTIEDGRKSRKETDRGRFRALRRFQRVRQRGRGEGKAIGIALTDSYVYNVRSSVKTAANKASAKPRTATKTRVAHPAARAAANVGSVESLLKAVAAAIGLGRPFDILMAESARVTAAIGA
jgi:hypothetical protein